MNNNIFNRTNLAKGIKWFFKSYIWLFIILFLFDLISKQVVLNLVGGWDKAYQNGMPIYWQQNFIPGFMSFKFHLNSGAAWGMMGSIDNNALRRTLLIGVSLIMTGIFTGYYIIKYKKLNGAYRAFLMAISAGAFGNFIDRAFYPDGMVIDFLKFDFINFPIFNIADAVLVVSLIAMVIYLIIDETRTYLKKKKGGESLNIEIKEESKDEKDNH